MVVQSTTYFISWAPVLFENIRDFAWCHSNSLVNDSYMDFEAIIGFIDWLDFKLHDDPTCNLEFDRVGEEIQ